MSVLLIEKNGPVVTLTINRPESRNPLGEDGDGPVFADACAAINADRTVRCAILTGAGTAFSAGGNVKAMRERSGTFAGPGVHIRERYRTGIHRIVKSLWNLEVPLIAAVNGPAIGLGNDVACLADMRIAADTAVFGATFLKIGLVPGDGGSWILPRTIGHARAAELFFTGDTIDAQTAQSWGLVSRVVPAADLMKEANALAAKISRQPPDVLRMTKRMMREGQNVSFDIIMEMSAAYQSLAHLTEDHQEAVSAFFDKRQGDYRGR
ncbi:MAG: crotonase/enoyl-CoA hydratase family protein [Alphaproteobacteria bacterium]|nr:crotonase/enoyl-CoA hydratase family protein [Alphaproteobacteria bacterium]MBL7096149.1 crotonase/enoyl-CoA hydratase family protein [Alphaproteobacteria bacterium]